MLIVGSVLTRFFLFPNRYHLPFYSIISVRWKDSKTNTVQAIADSESPGCDRAPHGQTGFVPPVCGTGSDPDEVQKQYSER